MQTIEMLEKEVATLQTRAADLDAEYSRAITKRDAAREALINGSGTTGTLTQAQTTVQALEEARAEIERRAAAKQREIATANAAAERARKIAEFEAASTEYSAARENLFADARVLAETFNSGIPTLLESMKHLHAANLHLANLAGKIEGVEAPSTNDYFVVQKQVESFGGDLTAQRSFFQSLDMRRQWELVQQQGEQHQRENALGLNERTHQGEPVAQIVETHVVTNAEAITRILDGKATLTRF
jgi:predicted nucleic acid-binding protein